MVANKKSHAGIQKKYVGPQMVTRSRARLFLKHNIRNVHVAIEQDMKTLCLQWLLQSAQSEAPAAPAAHEAPRNIVQRRNTVSGSNLFSVDRIVREFGSDFLPAPSNPPRTSRGFTIQAVDGPADPGLRPYLRIGRLKSSDFIRDRPDHNQQEENPVDTGATGADVAPNPQAAAADKVNCDNTGMMTNYTKYNINPIFKFLFNSFRTIYFTKPSNE